MSRRIAVALSLFSSLAAADTAPPYQLQYRGAVVDLRTHQVITAAPAARPRCTADDGPYSKQWRDEKVQATGNRLGADLQYVQGTTHLLYSTGLFARGKGPLRSVVVDAATGKTLATAAWAATSLVEDAAGKLLGLLEMRSGELRLYDLAGKLRWRTAVERVSDGDVAAALVVGDRLLIALYHRFSTGSSLRAFDFKTGALSWKGDVVQLRVGHSEYYNDVQLVARGADVLMYGFESYGCYLQIFDVATGARRFADVDKTDER